MYISESLTIDRQSVTAAALSRLPQGHTSNFKQTQTNLQRGSTSKLDVG